MKVDSAYKVFAELPDLTSPAPQVKRPNPNIIGIIPLFADPYFNEHNFPAYLKAAIYSRQTFLLHTDAYETQTPIKFYIDASLKQEVCPILERNGLDAETDVLYFDVPPLPDTLQGIYSKYGKKTRLFCDLQLSDYKQVVFWDADTFKLIQPKSRNIFARALEREYPSLMRIKVLQRRDWRPEMIRNSVKNVMYGGIGIQEIFEKAGLGRTLQAITGYIFKPLNCFGVYPAKRMHTEHGAFVDWIDQHGPYIGHDEYCVALGAAKFNIPLRSLLTDCGFTDVNILYYLMGDTAHSFVHGKPTPDHVHLHQNLLIDLAD